MIDASAFHAARARYRAASDAMRAEIAATSAEIDETLEKMRAISARTDHARGRFDAILAEIRRA